MWVLASTWDLSPLKILWLKTLLWECTIWSSMTNSAKQIQPLKHFQVSNTDYYMWPLINHPFYFRCWADLLASFLFPSSCHCCFFSASLFTCFPLAGFIRQFPPRKMQTLLPALSWGSEKGSEAESWVQHSSVVCAHFEVRSWLLISGKSCLWFSGPAITLCTQTTAQGKQPGESCHISGIFMMHYGEKKALKKQFSWRCLPLRWVCSQNWLRIWKSEVPKILSKQKFLCVMYPFLGSISHFCLFNWHESKDPSLLLYKLITIHTCRITQ